MTADGFSLDDQRQPVKENDIPDIINRLTIEIQRKNKIEREQKNRFLFQKKKL